MYKYLIITISFLLAIASIWFRPEFLKNIEIQNQSSNPSTNESQDISDRNIQENESIKPGDELIEINHLSQIDLAEFAKSEIASGDIKRDHIELESYFDLLKELDLACEAVYSENYVKAQNILLALLNNKAYVLDASRFKEIINIIEKLNNLKPVNIFPDTFVNSSFLAKIITIKNINYNEISNLKSELNMKIHNLKSSYYSVELLKKYIENEQTK